MSKKFRWGWFFAVTSVAAWVALTYLFNRDAAEELRQNLDDVDQAAAWESSGGARGTVRGTVIDACSDVPAKEMRYRRAWSTDKDDVTRYAKLCPVAVRAAVRYYGDGALGEYGCTQAMRAVLLYTGLGDDLSMRIVAKCAKK